MYIKLLQLCNVLVVHELPNYSFYSGSGLGWGIGGTGWWVWGGRGGGGVFERLAGFDCDFG